MARKPKIQGVISPELKQQWDVWKENNGYQSDGEGLTKLLNSYFGDNGDNYVISGGDNGDNKYNELSEKQESLISEVDNLKQEVEAIKKR